MSVPLTINGVTFNYPVQFDHNWGPTLTNWSIAVTNALKPIAGGFLTLSPNPSTGISFANATNTGFLNLTVNGSNQLTFNGVPIAAAASLTNDHIFVGNVSNQAADVAMTGDVTISNTGVTTLGALKVTDSQISATAAIALTKLASTTAYFWYAANAAGVLTPLGVTASKVVITDANGLPSASSVTPTELGYVSGATSSIQTQLNSLAAQNFVPSGAMIDFCGPVPPSGWLACDGSSVATATYPNLFSAIGYSWGGSGANFSLPNMTRRVGMGSGGAGTATIGNAVGNVGGEEGHTLITAELPTALGTASSSSVVTDPGHTHIEHYANGSGPNAGLAATSASFAFNAGTANNASNTTSSSTTGITVATSTTITNSGGGSAHNNIQPSAIVLKIIKT